MILVVNGGRKKSGVGGARLLLAWYEVYYRYLLFHMFHKILTTTHGHLRMSTPEKSDQASTPPPYRYAGFTPAQKWQEAVKLRKMAWDLKTAMVKSNHPDWTAEQVNAAVREIFLYATT